MESAVAECEALCPVRAALDLIGGKWKGLVLYHLLEGPLRFNHLQKRLQGVTQRMLTLQLRELEADGLIHREVYPVIPPKVEYSLSPRGATLEPILRALREWGVQNLLPAGAAGASSREAQA